MGAPRAGPSGPCEGGAREGVRWRLHTPHGPRESILMSSKRLMFATAHECEGCTRGRVFSLAAAIG